MRYMKPPMLRKRVPPKRTRSRMRRLLRRSSRLQVELSEQPNSTHSHSRKTTSKLEELKGGDGGLDQWSKSFLKTLIEDKARIMDKLDEGKKTM
jgi:hypothetical protein